ncbi:hypothetical protein FACS1894195_1410 [Bacteroidia bacterium]|nr:hypothetical protein FACS1894195_1410 [Bacteroidia bacterium]
MTPHELTPKDFLQYVREKDMFSNLKDEQILHVLDTFYWSLLEHFSKGRITTYQVGGIGHFKLSLQKLKKVPSFFGKDPIPLSERMKHLSETLTYDNLWEKAEQEKIEKY